MASDIPVFMIANLEIEDAERYKSYEKGFFPLLKKHGGSFLTVDDQISTLEGSTAPTGRIVIFQFPSETAAQGWYADPEYQALSEHRRAATTLVHLTMVHGLPPRS